MTTKTKTRKRATSAAPELAELAREVAALALATGLPLSAVVVQFVREAIDRGDTPDPIPAIRMKCRECARVFVRPASGNGSTKLFCSERCAVRWHDREAHKRLRAKRKAAAKRGQRRSSASN